MSTQIPARPYEEQLNRDPGWALSEGSKHFEDRSAVHETLRRVVVRLKDLGVDYSIVNGMALFRHGLRRFTEDVDILVTRVGLKTIHEHLDGTGYVPPFRNSRNLRDAASGVRIEFLISGQYPGGGKPKPVSFPRPDEVSIELNGIKYISLGRLIELKLASGISNPGRMKDLADVQELIKLLDLPEDFALPLNPYVHEKFEELWNASRANAPVCEALADGAAIAESRFVR